MSSLTENSIKENRPVFRIGASVAPVKLGTHLLSQQLWCWGCDIEAQPGNLLVDNGFERIEKPVNSKSASIYRRQVSPTARVILRGFGIFYGDDRWGGIFLQRYGFQPRFTPMPDLETPAWQVQDLPRLTTPRFDNFDVCRSLLSDLIEWIYSYEMWVLKVQGLAWRAGTVKRWKKNKERIIQAEEIALTWASIKIFLCEGPEEQLASHWNRLGILAN